MLKIIIAYFCFFFLFLFIFMFRFAFYNYFRVWRTLVWTLNTYLHGNHTIKQRLSVNYYSIIYLIRTLIPTNGQNYYHRTTNEINNNLHTHTNNTNIINHNTIITNSKMVHTEKNTQSTIKPLTYITIQQTLWNKLLNNSLPRKYSIQYQFFFIQTTTTKIFEMTNR